MNSFVKCLLLAMLLIAVSVVLSGCMDAMDINKKYIVTTVAIDQKGDQIWFYVEVANIRTGEPGVGGGGSMPLGTKYLFVKGHGKSFSEARQDIDRQLDQPIYLSGVRTLLLSEDFAKEGLVQYLYRLRSDETYRKKVLTVITRSSLDDIFATLNEKNVSAGYSIENTIIGLENQGEAFSRTTSRILENLSSQYCGILIPCVGLRDKEAALIGYSVVSGNRVTGFIPIDQCTGLNILKVEKARTFFSVPYYGNVFTVKTMLGSRKITPYYQNGAISFLFSLSFEATVEYGNNKTPYNLNRDALKEMEGILRQMIQQELYAALDQAKNTFGTDYLQMDDAFRIKYPVVFDHLDWGTAFKSASVFWDLKVDLSVSPSLDYGENKSR